MPAKWIRSVGEETGTLIEAITSFILRPVRLFFDVVPSTNLSLFDTLNDQYANEHSDDDEWYNDLDEWDNESDELDNESDEWDNGLDE